MAKFFINDEIYYHNKKLPPRKRIINYMEINPNGHNALCYADDDNAYTIELDEIFEDNDNPIKDARQRMNMTQKEFSTFLNIPKRTIEDWERKISQPPNYVLEMIMEKVFSSIDWKGEKKHEKSNNNFKND